MAARPTHPRCGGGGSALGFAFDGDGLAGIKAPVQLWGGTADRRVPVDSNVQLLAGLLGDRAEVHIVDGAGHFAFLAPCNPALKAAEPEIWEMVCVDGSGFDRPAFQRDFDAQVVRFFSSALKP